MQLGFSVAGAAFLPVLFASNARWARSRLSGFEELQKHESKALLVPSYVGQVLATCTSLSFVCLEGASFSWTLTLAAASLLRVLYEIAWVRYFRGVGKLDGMYQS